MIWKFRLGCQCLWEALTRPTERSEWLAQARNYFTGNY